MNRKLIPSIIFVLLMISTSASADLFVTPYGSISYFQGLSTVAKLEVEDLEDIWTVGVSQNDSAVGGGVIIGTRSESSGLILALNIEYITGEDLDIFRTGETNVTNPKIEAPAMAFGGIIGAIVPGISNENFQSVLGIEIGALKPSGTINLTYDETVIEDGNPVTYTREKEADFGETEIYVSFFFTEDYSFSDMFAVSGSLGWRSVNTSVVKFETENLSGGYAQEYSGFYLRLGLTVNF